MINGTIIKKRRQYLNLTQKQLADKLFITQQTISKWETNNVRPGAEIYENVITALGLDEKTKVYDIYDKDHNKHFGIIGNQSNRKWAMQNKDKFIIKFLYGGNIIFWRPKNNEKGRVITL